MLYYKGEHTFIMKLLATAAAVSVGGLGFLAPAVEAGTLVHPNLFAREYCSFRADGYGKNDAIKAAFQASSYEGEEVRITRPDGTETSADSVRAARAVADRCPQHL